MDLRRLQQGIAIAQGIGLLSMVVQETVIKLVVEEVVPFAGMLSWITSSAITAATA